MCMNWGCPVPVSKVKICTDTRLFPVFILFYYGGGSFCNNMDPCG